LVGCFLVQDLFINVFFFFFQAEDGIRDSSVTGVQTCALPISEGAGWRKSGCGREGAPSLRRYLFFERRRPEELVGERARRGDGVRRRGATADAHSRGHRL